VHGSGDARLRGAEGRSDGDHRLAMTIGIAALLAAGESTLHGARCAAVSYPAFWEDLERLTGTPAAV